MVQSRAGAPLAKRVVPERGCTIAFSEHAIGNTIGIGIGVGVGVGIGIGIGAVRASAHRWAKALTAPPRRAPLGSLSALFRSRFRLVPRCEELAFAMQESRVMQSQEASNPDVLRSALHLVEPLVEPAVPLDFLEPAAEAPSSGGTTKVFDQLLADHRAVAAAFDLIEHELAQASPDRETCCFLLLEIDSILGTHAYAKRRLLESVFIGRRDDLDELIVQLEALLEVDRAWSAKARVLMDRVERELFGAVAAA
jgi:hypothetical protein